jgi:hypothetical protein
MVFTRRETKDELHGFFPQQKEILSERKLSAIKLQSWKFTFIFIFKNAKIGFRNFNKYILSC